MSMDLDVLVNGTSRIGSVANVKIYWRLNSRSTARLSMKSGDGSYKPTVGHEVIIQKAGQPIFGGSIDEFDEGNPGHSILFYDVPLVGYEQRFDRVVENQFVYGRAPWTSNAISDQLTFVELNPFVNGDIVAARTTGTLPSPLTTGTKYYVVNSSGSTCQLSLSAGGSPINLTNDGSGYHHLIWYTGTIVRKIVALRGALESITAGTIRDGIPWEPAPFKYNNYSQIIDTLASYSGYVWYVNASKQLQFIPRNEFTAPYDAAVNQHILFGSVFFRHTREEYANAILLQISEDAFGPSLVTKTGDGVRRIFRLATPIEEVTSISVGGSEKTVGVYQDGAETGSQWYYTPGDHFIYQDPSETVVPNGASFFVSYRPVGFDSVYVEDTAEQSARAAIEGGSGKYVKFISDTNILSVDGGNASASSALERYKSIATEMRYRSKTHGLLPGQLQTVTLPVFGISGATFLINEVTAEWSGTPVEPLIYSVSAISGTRLSGFLEVFTSFTGGSIGGGSGAVGGAGGSSGGSILRQSVALTDGPGSTAISVPVVSSAGLLVRITQSAVGGRQITWSSDFESSTPVDIAMSANAVTVMWFVEIGGKWQHAAGAVAG